MEKISWDDVTFGERKETDIIYLDKESPEKCALESLKLDDSRLNYNCTNLLIFL